MKSTNILNYCMFTLIGLMFTQAGTAEVRLPAIIAPSSVCQSQTEVEPWVFADKIELEIKEIEMMPSGEHKWQPGSNRPLEYVSISKEDKAGGFYSVAQVTIDKTDGKRFQNPKGYFLKQYETGNETAVPVFRKENKQGFPIELPRIRIEESKSDKLSNGLIEVRIDEKTGTFDIYDLTNRRLIVKRSTIGFSTKPYVDLNELGRIAIETDQPETSFSSNSAAHSIKESSRLSGAFSGGKSMSLVSRWNDQGELEVQFTLYPDSSFVDLGFSFKNLHDQPVRLTNIEVLNGLFLPELDHGKMMTLDGNSGHGNTSVNHEGRTNTENNVLCYFPDRKQINSLVAGGLTYRDFRKWVKVARDTISISAKDVVGKRVDPESTYFSEDRFYLNGLTDNPFEALENYARTTKAARGIELNYYSFPSVCMWFLSVTHFGADATSENSTVGAVKEMEHIRESGFLNYSPVAVRLVPDNYEQNNEQGWWDDAHWQRHGRKYRCVVDHHYKEPFETTAKWGSKIIELGGIPLTYFQPGIRSEDYAKAFPGHMLYNQSQKFVRENKKVVSDPHALIGIGGIPDLVNPNDWIDGWGKLYAESYDYTDPEYLKHWRDVNHNLHVGGVKGVFYDYPDRAYPERGGMEDRYSTALKAYCNVFRIPHEVLGPHAYLQERLGIGSDATLEYVNSVRTEGDTNVITTRILNKAANRWYKNRLLTNFDMDGKALVEAGHGKDRYQIGGIHRRSILTLSYAVSGRLLLTESFSRFSDEVLHDLSRVIPFHSSPLSARPLHAFAGGMPVLDFPIADDWHQVILYNDSDTPKEFKLPISGNPAFGALGLDAGNPYYFYDFWNNSFLGQIPGDKILKQLVAPGEARMISVHAVKDCPQWISTDRHIMQGYVDLVSKPAWDPSGKTLSGISSVIGHEPYLITIALNGYHPQGATAVGAEVNILLRKDNPDLADLIINSVENQDISWEIIFSK